MKLPKLDFYLTGAICLGLGLLVPMAMLVFAAWRGV